MTSSSRFDSAAREAGVARLSPDEAAAIMAGHQRVRVLGPSAPGPARQSMTSSSLPAPAGGPPPAGFIGYTVNQTPFSLQAPAIVSGAGGDTGGDVGGDFFGDAIVIGGASGSAIPGSPITGPAVIPGSPSTAAPVTPGSPITGPAFIPGSAATGMVATPGSPATGPAFIPGSAATGMTVGIPSGGMTSSSPAVRSGRSVTGRAAIARGATAGSRPIANPLSGRSGSTSGSVRVVTTSDGRLVITNLGANGR